ncbi:MAG: 6-phospho-3-hexuloisomerase [Lacticaseibacillus paracasei]
MSELSVIIDELKSVPDPNNDGGTDKMLDEIIAANHIFLSGAGRSGLMIKAFANRLLQMGYRVSVVGEVSSPHTHPGDLLILNSASGSASKLIIQAQIAHANGVRTVVVTTAPQSKLGMIADVVVKIEAQSKVSHTNSIQPMGALFEQFSLLLFDAIVIRLMKVTDVEEETMRNNHADME